MTLSISLIKKYNSFIKYAIFGILTTIVNVISYYISYEVMKISNFISAIIAWFFAVSFAFVTNKMYVFNKKNWNKRSIKECINFFVGRIATGVVEISMMCILVDVLKFNGTIMKIITNVVIIILNYIVSKIFVFNEKISADVAKC